jgi:hypothetical protein
VHLQRHVSCCKPASVYMYALLDALLLTSKTRDTEVRMSGGSSCEKSFSTGRGKGGRKGPPIVWEGLLVLNPIRKQCMSFQLREKVNSPRRSLLEDTMTAKKIGQNVCVVRTASCRCAPRGRMEVVVSSNARELG